MIAKPPLGAIIQAPYPPCHYSFHYRNRYPDDPALTIWKPVMEASEPIDPGATGREKPVNIYDNGIRFPVDEFLGM